ncbi:uncharacterized protein G2W53_039176 [Senna tora]|uniref:Uncharacterized protein n=1 Tax=Senna tora TaxID=362788 RepID=A0A834SQB6_9FABA|nr:uncharacterized protein G2W53_039176 [Senna tora]
MSETQINDAGADSRRQPSRLQRRAPSSLLVNRSCDWNVAIPLLSPLATSPTAEEEQAPAATMEDAPQQEPHRPKRLTSSEPEKAVFKKWLHPAAPFWYEPPPPSSTVERIADSEAKLLQLQQNLSNNNSFEQDKAERRLEFYLNCMLHNMKKQIDQRTMHLRKTSGVDHVVVAEMVVEVVALEAEDEPLIKIRTDSQQSEPFPENPIRSSILLISTLSMAEAQENDAGAGSRRQPSRLQRRAPSSLLVNRPCDWNVAIPLLSPLATSPTTEEQAPAATREDAAQQEPLQSKRFTSAEPEKAVFKTWQHPAAPFWYEPPPSTVVRPFVPVELCRSST